MQTLFIQKYLRNNRFLAYSFAFGFVIFSFVLGVSVGSASIPLFEMFALWTLDDSMKNILFNIRMPRVILAFLVGASLAICGAAFQGLLKNPLADPYTLGVSSGASVGAVFVLFFGISLFGVFTLPIVAIISGFATILIVLLFAKIVQRSISIETIILTGIIFSSFLGSLLSLMVALSGEELRQIMNWLLGSVGMRGWKYIFLLLPFFLVGSFILLLNSSELNALSLGEERAAHLGVHVQARKMIILISASIVTGAAVAVSGTIGFVGLVIPHMIRLLFGTDYRHLLPLSMLFGGSFLILADLIARTLVAPVEIPIGVITALIGAPVFAFILFRQRKESRG